MGADVGMGELLAELVRFTERHRSGGRAGGDGKDGAVDGAVDDGVDDAVKAATERLLARRARVSDLADYGRARGWSLTKCLALLAHLERLHGLVARSGPRGALLGETTPGPLYPWELFDPSDVEANRAVRWSLVLPWKDRVEGDMARTLYLTAARLLRSEEPWDRDARVVRDRLLGLTADLGVVVRELEETIADLASLGADDGLLAPITLEGHRIGRLVAELQVASQWLAGQFERARRAEGAASDAS